MARPIRSFPVPVSPEMRSRSAQPGSLPATPFSVGCFFPHRILGSETSTGRCSTLEQHAGVVFLCWHPSGRHVRPPESHWLRRFIAASLLDRRVNFRGSVSLRTGLLRKSAAPAFVTKSRRAAVGIEQPSLQFDATHPGRAHIDDQATHVPLIGIKRFFRGRECVEPGAFNRLPSASRRVHHRQ
jgi:hypothetical protein